MSGFSTLRDRSEALREGVEELLLESSGAVAAHLKDAEVAVSRFCDLGATDQGVGALDAVRVALDRAREALRALPRSASGATSDASLLDEAVAWAAELRVRALDEIGAAAAMAPPSRLPAPFGFRASKGAAALHEPREVPSLDLIAKSRAWDDLIEEGDDEASDRPSGAQPIPDRAAVDLARLGRDTMEDLAILGGLRRIDEEEPWIDAESFDERLLANLDLLWALDTPAHDDVPALGTPRALFRYVMEWSLPDWGRAFALSFGLGCSTSEAALRWVMLAMRRSPSSVLGAYVHGLSLGSSPHIEKTIATELRNEGAPSLLAALLEVAARRRLFEASAVIPLLAHPDPSVKGAALIALRSAPYDIAVASTGQVFATSSDRVAAIAADELARRGRAEGLDHLRGVLRETTDLGERTMALRAIAVAGLSKDEALVAQHALEREDGAVWLSFYGRPSVVPLILDSLEKLRTAGANGVAMAAAERAFERVTAIDAHDDVKILRVKWDESQLAKRAPRLRRGVAYGAAAILDELAHPRTRQGERRILHRELPLVVPSAPVVDLDGFVASQTALLATIDAD